MIDEDMTARLVRLGGRRSDVPADREARVKQAFLQEVRAGSRARAIRRRLAVTGIGLSLALAVALALRAWPSRAVAPIAAVVAVVERVEGNTTYAAGQEVRVGDDVESGSARISLRLSSGDSLRFDRASRARLVSPHRIELADGSMYVDSGVDRRAASAPSSTTASGLEIVTPLGVVTDIGTQFEVRLSASSIRVRVRSGVVQVRGGVEPTIARPGMELTVTSMDTTMRAVDTFGEEWAWAARLAPDFPIEGRSLNAFLDYLCREQGWTLVYEDPRLALESSGMILHGPTQGVPLADALAIVLPTTGLTYRLDNGTLTIAR